MPGPRGKVSWFFVVVVVVVLFCFFKERFIFLLIF